MVTSELVRALVPTLYRSVQTSSSTPQKAHIPTSAILFEVLKALELQLQERGLIDTPAEHGFNPMWFLAETERNVHLWRNGLSLSELDKFEFWIDFNSLAEKRLSQLAAYDASNPFMNPLWGTPISDRDLADREAEYLKSLRDCFNKIKAHAHALSHIGSQFRDEIDVNGADRELIMLPSTK